MKHTLPSVTVAVCAYNEQDNIAHFLRSVLKQKQQGYVLEKILVISDGSTDQTNATVKKFESRHSIVEFIESPVRLGKSMHLNTIYQRLSSDILVQSDADVIWKQHVVKSVIAPIVQNPKIGMCGGNPQPLQGSTFVEKAVNMTTKAYIPLRWLVRGGSNIFSADGRLLAYRKETVKKIIIPDDMIANDMYTYFACLSLGYFYTFVPKAIVYYRSPQTMRDQVRQNTRFLAARIRMEKYFSKHVLRREFYIPGNLLRKNMITIFGENPLMAAYIYLLNKYCSVNAILQEKQLTGVWPIAHTTKRLIHTTKWLYTKGALS